MIDVAFTRAELRQADVAVVIDVLRATSTASQALAAGYDRVLCAESIELALQLRAPGHVLAGECHCVRAAGFDQGNSPSEARERRGEVLVLATTNGAPAIVAATRHAPRVLLASLLNLDAVVGELRRCSAGTKLGLQLVCAGTNGAAALEDVYVAGRVSEALAGERSDAALIAEGVAGAFATPLAALEASANAAVLREVGLTGDIGCCATESELDLVPAVIAAGTGLAAVRAVAGAGEHASVLHVEDRVRV